MIVNGYCTNKNTSNLLVELAISSRTMATAAQLQNFYLDCVNSFTPVQAHCALQVHRQGRTRKVPALSVQQCKWRLLMPGCRQSHFGQLGRVLALGKGFSYYNT